MKVELTEEIRQDASKDPCDDESAAAYMVLDFAGAIECHLFAYVDDAIEFAERLSRRHKESVRVYPLYASESFSVND